MGSGQCETEVGDFGHGYDRAHGLREADGSTEKLQPEEQGQENFQPLLTFIAETREFVGGELRNGDRPTGKQIARHLESCDNQRAERR